MKNKLWMAMVGLAITISMTCRAQETTSGGQQPSGSAQQSTTPSTASDLSSEQSQALQKELDELQRQAGAAPGNAPQDGK